LSRRYLFFDRRVETRVRCDLTCTFQREAGEGALAHAADLSAGGMRLQHVGPPLEREEPVLVQFNLEGETFSVCGRAVRTLPLDGISHEAGLSFSGLDRRMRKRLRSCLTI